MSSGTVDVTAGFNGDHRHGAHRHDAARPRAPACRSPGRPTPPWPAGQFSIWVVSPANGWYVGKIHDAAERGTASYADSVDPERARRHRLPHLRLLPRHQRRPLGHLRHEPGHGRRDAPASTRSRSPRPRAPRARPRAPACRSPGRPTSGRQRPVQHLGGQSPANGWYVGKIHDAADTAAPPATPTASTSTCPSTPATASTSTTAPPRGDPWGIYGMGPGTVNVTAI